jgi:hypothetical protein
VVSTRQREREAQSDRPVGPVGIWAGVPAGPLAWTAHLLVAYFFVGVMCATGLGFLIHLTTLVTLVIAAGGGLLAYRNLRRPDLTDGARFAALGGVLLSVMFGFAIVMESLPSFGLGPCANG